MKLYLISILNYPYDSYNAHIIAANTEEEVRNLASGCAADEGTNVWKTANIEEIGTYTGYEFRPYIVLSSFNAG